MCHFVGHNADAYDNLLETARVFSENWQTEIDKVKEKQSNCHGSAKKTESERLTFLAGIGANERRIKNKCDDVVQWVKTQTSSLVSQLDSLKKRTEEEIESNEESIFKELALLESFTRYYQEVIDNATATDVCRLAGEIQQKAKELQDMDLTDALTSTVVTFAPSDVTDTLIDARLNIIGSIVVGLSRHLKDVIPYFMNFIAGLFR